MAPTAAVAVPSRKQNVACDACRTKKVRCLRESLTETCAQCATKGAECTSTYIKSLQDKTVKKRKLDDRPKDSSRDASARAGARAGEREGSALISNSARAGPAALPRARTESVRIEGSGAGAEQFGSASASASPGPGREGSRIAASGGRTRDGDYARQSPDASPRERQLNLLRFLFSPDAVTDLRWGYNDIADMNLCASGQSDLWESQDGRVYREDPSEAHLSIPDEGLYDLTDDILETFWSIAHIRSPLLNPVSFRERFAAPDTHPSGAVPHGMLALAIAMGARFSDNPIIAHDRDEMSERDEEVIQLAHSQSEGLPSSERDRQRGRTRSRIVQLLVARAREVIEVCKTHRIATLENCQVLSLLEVLLGQSMTLKDRYQAYNALCSTRHAYALKLMSREHLEAAFPEPGMREAAGYTWWHIAAADGWRSIFNRLTPFLFDEDFEIDSKAFTIDAPAEGGAGRISDQKDSAESPDSLTVLWLSAANAGCYICRKLCNGLWTSRVRQYGIATSTLRDFVHYNSLWRDKYIAKLGVPSKWPEQWDFLAAISSCSTDAYYHCLWMIVHRAIGEFGLQDELDAAKDGGVNIGQVELDSIKRRIREEAEHGAARVAALVGTLTDNGYLRLDPLILIYPVYLAGLLLAEAGKADALICVAGLKQYSIAYGHLWEMAEEVERLHERAMALQNAKREQGGQSRSLNQLLLAPAGHMGDMGPWGLDGGPSYMGGHSPGDTHIGGFSDHRTMPDNRGQHAQQGGMGVDGLDFSHSLGYNGNGGAGSSSGHRRPSVDGNPSFQLPPIQDLTGFADQAGSGASGGHRQFRSPNLPGTSSIAPELRSISMGMPSGSGSGMSLGLGSSLAAGFGREPGTTGGYMLQSHPTGLGSGTMANDRFDAAASVIPSPDARSSSFSVTDDSDKGKAREEWHKTGAGAVLAANGFTALPMTPSSASMPAAPSKDTASALFDWIQRP